MKYIFLFTLAPVQSFIAQARKTQDLYAGSLILSNLTKAAAKEATEKQGIILVFPQNTEGGASFPNRFIGIIEGTFKDEELQQKGQNIEDSVKEAFKKMAEDALKKVEKNAPIDFWEQINSHLDINWLFYPVEKYDFTVYQEVEAVMASLKNVRLISNKFSEQAGRKCSLDGERNALFRGQNTTNKLLEKQAQAVDGNNTGIWLKPNEGLSAVSLVKRTYRYDGQKEEFPSTAAVALSHQIKQLEKDTKKGDLYACYKQLFSANYPVACLNLVKNGYWDKINLENPYDWRTDFDDQFLFEENLTEKDIINPTQLKIAKEVQAQFKKDLNHKYYAIIAFDGDKMGQLLSGQRCEKEPEDLAVFQSRVSDLLMSFSKWIYDNLNKKTVDVIYTGGDDFLGFVNLNDLFDVVKTLRIRFKTEVNQKLQNEYPLKDKDNFTFSMGITVAHYKTPLSIVLQKARDLEKLAKQKDKGNRDAFAIAVLKHSGESHEAYFKWDLKDEKLPQWFALEKLVKHFEEDCSETFVRLLDREFYYLQDEKGELIDREERLEFTDVKTKEKVNKSIFMLQTELFRLAYRSLKEDKKSKERAKCLSETVWQLFKTDERKTHTSVAAENGMEAVKIALFLKRENKKNNQ